jgi:hypothetical protein
VISDSGKPISSALPFRHKQSSPDSKYRESKELMKAAIVHSFNKSLVIEDVPKPQPPVWTGASRLLWDSATSKAAMQGNG